MDKVKGFGEADAFPSNEAEARRIWPEFTRPTGGTAFLRNADNSTSGFESWLVCKANQRLGFRLADNPFVRRRRTMNHIDLATFRVDCLAIRETERALNRQNLL